MVHVSKHYVCCCLIRSLLILSHREWLTLPCATCFHFAACCSAFCPNWANLQPLKAHYFLHAYCCHFPSKVAHRPSLIATNFAVKYSSLNSLLTQFLRFAWQIFAYLSCGSCRQALTKCPHFRNF